ncbi:unnamed protein product [Amoebophrya sp. A120]|nr:unnamed protein product [Amoebophrya sp. A120]|eukprot:GSA120T00025708001.1
MKQHQKLSPRVGLGGSSTSGVAVSNRNGKATRTTRVGISGSFSGGAGTTGPGSPPRKTAVGSKGSRNTKVFDSSSPSKNSSSRRTTAMMSPGRTSNRIRDTQIGFSPSLSSADQPDFPASSRKTTLMPVSYEDEFCEQQILPPPPTRMSMMYRGNRVSSMFAQLQPKKREAELLLENVLNEKSTIKEKRATMFFSTPTKDGGGPVRRSGWNGGGLRMTKISEDGTSSAGGTRSTTTRASSRKSGTATNDFSPRMNNNTAGGGSGRSSSMRPGFGLPGNRMNRSSRTSPTSSRTTRAAGPVLSPQNMHMRKTSSRKTQISMRKTNSRKTTLGRDLGLFASMEDEIDEEAGMGLEEEFDESTTALQGEQDLEQTNVQNNRKQSTSKRVVDSTTSGRKSARPGGALSGGAGPQGAAASKNRAKNHINSRRTVGPGSEDGSSCAVGEDEEQKSGVADVGNLPGTDQRTDGSSAFSASQSQSNTFFQPAETPTIVLNGGAPEGASAVAESELQSSGSLRFGPKDPAAELVTSAPAANPGGAKEADGDLHKPQLASRQTPAPATALQYIPRLHQTPRLVPGMGTGKNFAKGTTMMNSDREKDFKVIILFADTESRSICEVKLRFGILSGKQYCNRELLFFSTSSGRTISGSQQTKNCGNLLNTGFILREEGDGPGYVQKSDAKSAKHLANLILQQYGGLKPGTTTGSNSKAALHGAASQHQVPKSIGKRVYFFVGTSASGHSNTSRTTKKALPLVPNPADLFVNTRFGSPNSGKKSNFLTTGAASKAAHLLRRGSVMFLSAAADDTQKNNTADDRAADSSDEEEQLVGTRTGKRDEQNPRSSSSFSTSAVAKSKEHYVKMKSDHFARSADCLNAFEIAEMLYESEDPMVLKPTVHSFSFDYATTADLDRGGLMFFSL